MVVVVTMIMHFSWYAQNQCFNFLLMVGGVGMGEGQEIIEVEANVVGGGWQGRVERQQKVGVRHLKVTKRRAAEEGGGRDEQCGAGGSGEAIGGARR
jgi:hypothetical protein